MIEEKTPRERAAMQFSAAGLGSQSAHEAARLLFETGMSFETAAVMGQRLGEACSATPATIREAANRHRRATAGPPTKTAWGRPVQEDERAAESPAPAASAVDSGPQPPPGAKVFTTGRSRVVGGVVQEEVSWFEPVRPDQRVVEQEKPTHTAWGRKLED